MNATLIKDGKLEEVKFIVNGKERVIRKCYHDNGKLKEETRYTNGKKHGISKTYYKTGELETETPYIDGKQHGIYKGYYKTGELRAKIPVIHGERSGVEKVYYENGKLMSERPFENGKEDGISKWYYKSGKLMSETPYKNGEANVDTVKQHLLSEYGEEITEEWIAISTGQTKELEDENLFSPTSKVKIVITVEALKEGWDCSFAYVLCSVSGTKSAMAIEQLLGRVLRMPYAKRRRADALNLAYVYGTSDDFQAAAERFSLTGFAS